MKDFSFHIFREIDTRFQFLRGMLTQKGTKLERLQTPLGSTKSLVTFHGGCNISFRYERVKFIYLLVHLFCNLFLFILFTLFFKGFTHCSKPGLGPLQEVGWRSSWQENNFVFLHLYSIMLMHMLVRECRVYSMCSKII